MWQGESKYCCHYEIPIFYKLQVKQNARFLSEVEYTWDSDKMWKSAEDEIREYLGYGVNRDYDLEFAEDIIQRPASPGPG
jgi:hypothetical protein